MPVAPKGSLQPSTLVTVAGVGEPGYGGDGGPAVEARLNEPKNLALDAHGHLFIADSENHLVRMVDLETGTITTVAGRPSEQDGSDTVASPEMAKPAGSDFDDPLGDLPTEEESRFAQLADLSGTVRFIVGDASGKGRFQGDGGPATQAVLNFPSAVAVDEHALYIADTMNHRVRKVEHRTGLMTTVAGTGQHRMSGDGGPGVAAALNEPSALAVDGKGNLYIADQSNNRVRRLNLDTGVITTVAGTGEAAYSGDGIAGTEAALAGPSGLAIGPDGALYIADTFNGRIRRLDLETEIITTAAGDGGEYRYEGRPNEFSTSLSRPYGIAVDEAGNILLTDSDSHLIRSWHREKRIVTNLAGNGLAQYSGDGQAAMQSSLNYPFGVAIDSHGTVYFADTFNHRIRMITAGRSAEV